MLNPLKKDNHSEELKQRKLKAGYTLYQGLKEVAKATRVRVKPLRFYWTKNSDFLIMRKKFPQAYSVTGKLTGSDVDESFFPIATLYTLKIIIIYF